MKFGTGERIEPLLNSNIFEWTVEQRHIFAYSYVMAILKKSDVVLDYGCGDGYGAHSLSKYCNKVIAVDSDIETIRRARTKYIADNCIFLTIDEYERQHEKIDMVVSFQVIEHVENLTEYFDRLKSNLKTGGKLYITTPNGDFRLAPKQTPWNTYHLKEYRYNDLLQTISIYCKQYEVLGISGSPVIKIIEKSRIAFLKKKVSYIYKIINKLLHYLCSSESKWTDRIISYLKKCTLSNKYFTTSKEIHNAIDFIVVCHNH